MVSLGKVFRKLRQGTHEYLRCLSSEQVWSTDLAFDAAKQFEKCLTKRTVERHIQAIGLWPSELTAAELGDEFGRPTISLVRDWFIEQARKRRDRLLFAQVYPLPDGKPCLHLNDPRGARFWIPCQALTRSAIYQALIDLRAHIGKSITVLAHGALVAEFRDMPKITDIATCPQAYLAPPLRDRALPLARGIRKSTTPQLERLEAESIYIIREAVAEAQNPVMMYSIGKDSAVMLHLARKAFFPSKPPFPLLHVDTKWKFQDMYSFRDLVALESGLDLIVYTNPAVVEKNINPFDHGSALHTDVSKTEALKQALDEYNFDIVLGGARRDEEKSRAKERIFSFRTKSHRWDPKQQQPEIWNLYNTRKNHGESIRVFPLSNWTELDIWEYISQENIPIPPLYFAKFRPVVVRPEMIMMVDDDRCRLLPGEKIEIRKVRFRTLGCYPLTSAIDSVAETVEDILLEVMTTNKSERQGRNIDRDGAASMEKKKQEGYF